MCVQRVGFILTVTDDMYIFLKKWCIINCKMAALDMRRSKLPELGLSVNKMKIDTVRLGGSKV